MAKLVIFKGSTPDRHVDLAEREYRIGRGDQNEIVLEDPTKGVSRLHAELRLEGGRFVILDLNSQNGIWIEGKRVPRAVLEPGIPVTIGPYRLVLEPQDAPGAAAATKPASPSVEAPRVKTEPPRPAPKPETRAEAQKPAHRIPDGRRGGRARTILLLAALFVLLAVAGVAIGLFWPIGQPDSPGGAAGTQPEPAAQQPQSETPAANAAQRVQTPPSGGEPAAARPAAPDATPPVAVEPPALPPAPPQATPEPPPMAAGGQTGARRAAAGGQAAPGGARVDPMIPARRAGETVAAWRSRTRQIQSLYRQGTTALRSGEFAVAIERLEAILKEDPAYLDVTALLDDARQNMRASAQKVFDDGTSLEKHGDYPGALQAYERAVGLDSAVEGASAAIGRVRGLMRVAGEDALKRARQYDALGRTAEAIAQFERALQLLPADHESRKAARDRLDVLKGGIK